MHVCNKKKTLLQCFKFIYNTCNVPRAELIEAQYYIIWISESNITNINQAIHFSMRFIPIRDFLESRSISPRILSSFCKTSPLHCACKRTQNFCDCEPWLFHSMVRQQLISAREVKYVIDYFKSFLYIETRK